MILDCETLSIDNSWSLTRKNACHIANQNEEMGVLSKAQQDLSNSLQRVDFRLTTIEGYMAAQIWIWGAIAVAIIGMMVKKIFTLSSK